jgi:uncharacterized protein (DUF342 family)
MSATLILYMPSEGEGPITIAEIKQELEKSEVVFGVDERAITACVEDLKYNQPTQIASGIKPKRGLAARFAYHFETENQHAPKEDADGRIDYHDMNFFQTCDAGALLVTKTPPTEGGPGKTVRGKDLSAPSGNDIPIKHGANTELSEDGLKLTSTVAGVIAFLHGKVSVSDVLTVNSDVDFSVGNIDSRGSVRVMGDVRAGFTLNVDGDLEVSGNVEDCTINVKGNILIKGGFYGKGEGVLSAGGDITLKYAENQKVISEGSVTIGGEIINCHVVASGSIIMKGRKGKIIGGEVYARDTIRSGEIGSEAGTPTRLAVGYDSELMDEYNTVLSELSRLGEDSDRIKEALYNLYRLQIDGKLDQAKKEALAKLEKFQTELPDNLEKLNQEKTRLEEELSKFKDARIIVESKLFPGVKAYFGHIYYEVIEEIDRCNLVFDGNQVVVSTFRE